MPRRDDAKVPFIAGLVVFVMVWGGPVGGSSARADELELSGTIRDFLDTHPDFEYTTGDDRGLVETIIGANARPVYAGPEEGTATTTGPDNFSQWYRDVEGVNVATEHTLVLENTPEEPAVFSFTDNAFFPIDGELLGDQDRSHNYHFTMELHAHFTYQGGESFSFWGDDDLWLFLNGHLVIDLGGVHPGQAADVVLDEVAESIGIEVGGIYDFALFFAERHVTESNFEITTSLVFLDPKTGDNDDIDATVDNCPFHDNTDQLDTDGDFEGDACDNCVGVPNSRQIDGDDDGIGDLCDNCPDVENADQANLDEDGLGDACDDDVDGDGVDGAVDCDDLDPFVQEAILVYEDEDLDGFGAPGTSVLLCAVEIGDGYSLNDTDNCPGTNNSDQADEDGDGFGDSCDACFADAAPDSVDGCPDPADDLIDLDMGADVDATRDADEEIREDVGVNSGADGFTFPDQQTEPPVIPGDAGAAGGLSAIDEGCQCASAGGAKPSAMLLLVLLVGVVVRRSIRSPHP